MEKNDIEDVDYYVDLIKTHDKQLVEDLTSWFGSKKRRRAALAGSFREKLGAFIDDKLCYEALQV